ncbi:MAG: glycosyltransferase family 2 protein [Thermodesulfovibrionales bacterium]|nr:glycosyltransferase family 2 protein [Thermodesulfovibrionales bacterium]
MAMQMIPVSVAVITLNEEAHISGCLKSVEGFFKEIVLVDSGSTDRTVDIARERGAKVITNEFAGYGQQKQFALEQCSLDWVLMLDADERLSPGCLDEIRALFSSGPDAAAYSFRRKGYIGDRWIWSCGWWPDRVIRLVDRKHCSMEGSIHERVKVEGDITDLLGIIDHYSFRDYSDMIARMNTYSTQSAIELVSNGAHVGALTPFAHLAWMFFRSYVLKFGFRQGIDGLTVSALTALNSFLKYSKCIEMTRNVSKD